MFAEGFPNPKPSKLSPRQTRVQLTMAKNNAWNNLEFSGLSQNHDQLSKDLQLIEKKTRLRRTQPFYVSKVLGNSSKYAVEQLKKKAPGHLKDFNISTANKTLEEMAIEYYDLMESIGAKPNLVIHKNGTLNKQEPTINRGDPEIRAILAFENNPLYKDNHFISGYPVSKSEFQKFHETGNIGLSPAERAQEINKLQRIQAQAERERQAAHSFYSSLPDDARIGNKQLREVGAIQERLKEDPKSPLTEKERGLLHRTEKYHQYKTEYSQKNPEIDRDEF